MELKEGIEWNSKTTLYNKTDDITYSTGTFNSVKHIKQLANNCSEKIKTDRGDPIIKVFEGDYGQTEMRIWFKNNLKDKMPNGTRGPKEKKAKSCGFYRAGIRDGLEVLSTKKVYKERKWGFKEGSGVRSYPCYTDVNNAKTLQWWLIYYE